MKNKLKIVYIGNRGHSAEVFDSIRGDERFTTVGVARGDDTENIDAFYNCLKMIIRKQLNMMIVKKCWKLKSQILLLYPPDLI